MLLFFIAAISAICGCASCDSLAAAAPAAKKVKFGLYVDGGASGNGVFHLASLIYHSPQAELVLLSAADIRNGKLNGIDLLVMPGGGSRKQCGRGDIQGSLSC